MKKHIIGLTLFSFIVSAAAIVYGFFSVSNTTAEKNLRYETPIFTPFDKTHCKLRIQSNQISPDIKQAVYNAKTKNLTWELSEPREVVFPVLHFFVKDEKGIRLLHSIHTVQYFTDANLTKFSNQCSELGNISSKANLYLILDASASAAENETERQNVIFDSDKAFPVTIDYGK